VTQPARDEAEIARALAALPDIGRVLRLSDPDQALDPGVDPRSTRARVAVAPDSVAGVQALLRWCGEQRISVVPQGGRTSVAGAAATEPDQIILSLGRLNRIEAFSAADRTVLVQAGVTLQALQERAAQHGLTTAIDLGARGSCTVGGMIATNAGGAEAHRYGCMRARVLGLEAVLADGSVFGDLSRTVKANTGYDVKQLFIGSEGTLGVITRAVLRLERALPGRATALVAFRSWEAACGAFVPSAALGSAVISRADLNSWNLLAEPAFELKSAMICGFLASLWREYGSGGEAYENRARQVTAPLFVLLELEAEDHASADSALERFLTDLAERALVLDALVARNQSDAEHLWWVREQWVTDRLYTHEQEHDFDVAVPLAALPQYVEELYRDLPTIGTGLRMYCLGHLGDGNLHLQIFAAPPLDASGTRTLESRVYEPLTANGGAFSAEHGIGLMKRDALRRYGDPVKLQLMAGIKRLLDPAGILNPGKIL
jgi:FAD/FMN-containing dehydrogenase